MGRKLYVGNLAYGVNDADLQQLFAAHGNVESAQVIMDRDTGRSKGFGFVEMGSDAEAQAAIAALNGKEVDGRSLTVNEARPKTEGGRGAFRGGPGASASKNREHLPNRRRCRAAIHWRQHRDQQLVRPGVRRCHSDCVRHECRVCGTPCPVPTGATRCGRSG